VAEFIVIIVVGETQKTNNWRNNKMKKEKCQNCPEDKRNDTQVNFRIWKHMRSWIDKENLNPRTIFIEACKELGYKPNE